MGWILKKYVCVELDGLEDGVALGKIEAKGFAV